MNVSLPHHAGSRLLRLALPLLLSGCASLLGVNFSEADALEGSHDAASDAGADSADGKTRDAG